MNSFALCNFWNQNFSEGDIVDQILCVMLDLPHCGKGTERFPPKPGKNYVVSSNFTIFLKRVQSVSFDIYYLSLASNKSPQRCAGKEEETGS